MEEPNNKVGKRKAHIVVKAGGGNIGGLIIWGGVVVVGSLIAAFAVKKRRQGSACDKKNCNHKGGSKQGLGFILQTLSSTSHLSSCCSGSTTVVESQVDSYAKDLILDQNPTPMINGVTQDLSDDDQHPIDDLAKESIPSSVECGDAYEFSFPVLDASLLDKVANGIKQSSGEDYMERTEVIKVEKIVDDVKIIAQGMSKVHAVDAPNDLMTGNENGKLEKVVDAENITTVTHSAVEMEKVVDAEIAISSTNSDDSEEETVEVEKKAAVETIVNKTPASKTDSANDTENSGEKLAPVEHIEVMKDGVMVDSSYAIAKNSSPLNFVGEGNDSGDGSPSKENINVWKGRDVANDERVIAETVNSMHSKGVADNQEEVDAKADPGEDLQLMEMNDASKHKVSLACSVEEEDENDGYVDNEEDNEHEIYAADEGEDSPEGTETSSAESNSAKIWSVESLDASFLELESGAVHLKDSAEKIAEEEGKSVARTLEKEVPGFVVENRRAHLTKWRSWALSIPALLLLLLLLFAHHNALFCNRLYGSFLVPSSSEN